MRFSRPCYDKYWRCPGWVGGGNKFGKRDLCDNGRIQVDFDKFMWHWRFHRCDKCDVIVFPYVIRFFDPTNWRSEIHFQWFRLRQWFEIKQIIRERRRNG